MLSIPHRQRFEFVRVASAGIHGGLRQVGLLPDGHVMLRWPNGDWTGPHIPMGEAAHALGIPEGEVIPVVEASAP